MHRLVRILILLLLGAVFANVAQAGDFYVWVWIDPDANTNGWQHKDFKKAVKAGFALYEAQCGLRFVFTQQQSKANILVKTSELYGGRGEGGHIHYRGLYRGDNTLWLSNGEISAGHGNAQSGAYTWTPFTSVSGLSRTLAHEEGHKLGWIHSSDARCLMYSGVGPGFCAHESADLRAWFPGSPKRLAEGEASYFDAQPISEMATP